MVLYNRPKKGGPFYVIKKDVKENALIVSKDKKDLLSRKLKAKNINWISGKNPKLPLEVEAKIRYGHKGAQAIIKRYKNGKIKVIFSKPQRAITPGQSVVFYKEEELLGGGIII